MCNTEKEKVSTLVDFAFQMLLHRNIVYLHLTCSRRISIDLHRSAAMNVLSKRAARAAMTKRIAIVWPSVGTKIANSKIPTGFVIFNLRLHAETSASVMISVAKMRIASNDADSSVVMMIVIASATPLRRKRPGIPAFWIVTVKNQMRTVRGSADFVAARERTTNFVTQFRRDHAVPIA